MAILRINIIGQKIALHFRNREVVADSRNYLYAEFGFSAEWDGISKTAVFAQGDEVYNVLLVEDRCLVPHEVIKSPGFTVSVFGGDLITANKVTVPVIESGMVEGIAPPEPTPDIYNQLVETVAQEREQAETAKTAASESAAFAEGSASSAAQSAEMAEASAEYAATSAANARISQDAAKVSADDAKAAAEAAQEHDNHLADKIALLEQRGNSYGDVDKTEAELLAMPESDRNTYINGFVFDRGAEKIVGGMLVYTSGVPSNEWEYNDQMQTWVDNGQSTVSMASNNVTGIVKGSLEDYKVSVDSVTGEMTVNGLESGLPDNTVYVTSGTNTAFTADIPNLTIGREYNVMFHVATSYDPTLNGLPIYGYGTTTIAGGTYQTGTQIKIRYMGTSWMVLDYQSYVTNASRAVNISNTLHTGTDPLYLLGNQSNTSATSPTYKRSNVYMDGDGNLHDARGKVASESSITDLNSGKVYRYWMGTQAEWDAWTGDKTDVISFVRGDDAE